MTGTVHTTVFYMMHKKLNVILNTCENYAHSPKNAMALVSVSVALFLTVYIGVPQILVDEGKL